MGSYRQLTFRDRIYIEVWHWESRTVRYMAERLGVSPTTVWRELERGKTGELVHGYRADLAEKDRRTRVGDRGRPRKVTPELARLIEGALRAGWSPEQISGRLRYEGKALISYETIYRYIKADKDEGGLLYLCLRRSGRKRQKRFYVPRKRADLVNRLSIANRPEMINKRRRIGDWERDLMFGDSRSSALMTFVERKTLYTVLRKVESKSPSEIMRKTLEAMGGRDMKCLSITNDNGFEFRNHEKESAALSVPIYFTNPYSSWEKGTCENTNGLIRQYFPKHFSMRRLDHDKTKRIEEALNSRPRKKLGFRTPTEVFSGISVPVFL